MNEINENINEFKVKRMKKSGDKKWIVENKWMKNWNDAIRKSDNFWIIFCGLISSVFVLKSTRIILQPKNKLLTDKLPHQISAFWLEFYSFCFCLTWVDSSQRFIAFYCYYFRCRCRSEKDTSNWLFVCFSLLFAKLLERFTFSE